MIYRKAGNKDFDQIIALNLKAYAQYRDALTPENWNMLEKNLSNRERMREMFDIAVTFVAEEEGMLAGVAFFVPHGNPTDICPAEWANIRLLGVDPEKRGAGIGKELMQRCIEEARTTGEKTIALHTSEFMDTARNMYERMGFAVVRELDRRFGKRYWLYKMELELKD